MSDLMLEKSAPETQDTAEESRAAQSESSKKQEETNDVELVTPSILNMSYRYVKLLGEGANGRTWLAKDRRNALFVAIKELKFVEDFKAFELFQREAEVLQSVSVRGVPVCYKSITKDLTGYIIQEYIPHPSLEQLLEKGKIFSEEEAFEILDKVSEILLALETQYIPAIVHRDIKPGNILYYPRNPKNDETRVWLIDFGAVDNAHKQSSGSTIAGTFGYMAPEQLQGEVSVRSDFYGLGATVLHLITGVFPYEIPVELFQMQFHPVIEEKAPKTTKALVDLLDKLLASNPEHRPADIHALRQAIREAYDLSKKYRKIQYNDVVIDYPPRTRLGLWYRNTKIGSRLHSSRLAFKQRRLEKRRARMIKKLEEEERKARERREAEERRLAEQRAKRGIECICTVRRVSVVTEQIRTADNSDDSNREPGYSYYQSDGYNEYLMREIRDRSLLEGIFCYEGDWHPAYVIAFPTVLSQIRCTSELQDDSTVSKNTFKVHFLPDKCDISVIENQTIWLTPEFYTRFTGKAAPVAGYR